MSCKFFSISTYDYIRNTCLHYIDELELLCISLGCDCYMMNVIQQVTDPMPTSFSHIVLCLFTFSLLLLQLLQNGYIYFCHCYHYYHTTLLLNILLQILSYPGVVELTTQLLILENILWLPLCRINKFGLNTLPSKTIAIPYTCGLSTRRFSRLFRFNSWLFFFSNRVFGRIGDPSFLAGSGFGSANKIKIGLAPYSRFAMQ